MVVFEEGKGEEWGGECAVRACRMRGLGEEERAPGRAGDTCAAAGVDASGSVRERHGAVEPGACTGNRRQGCGETT